MSLPIYIDAYSGYKANERPRQFVLDEEIYEIPVLFDQWYEPSATYFNIEFFFAQSLRCNPTTPSLL